MKIYISADIEGITGVTTWDETEKTHSDYNEFKIQMNKEVKAACNGAISAGAKEILVKDGHDTAANLEHSLLPEEVTLHRGWQEDPMSMMSALDSSFDAALFIGYHSRGGSNRSPISHTLMPYIETIKINGVFASEFLINVYTAALYDVPVLFVSGDKGLCEDVNNVNSNIVTLAVKEGIGGATINMHPNKAIREIEALVYKALNSDLNLCKIDLPKTFNVEISYKDFKKAYRNSFYKGAKLINEKTISFETDDYYEVLRFLHFTAS